MSASAAAPVTASMRRMPLPMERSETMMKPPTWPDRAAVGAATQLEAVVALDPDGAHLLAVLLVEERVRTAVDGLLHGHHLGHARAGPRGPRPGPRPGSPAARHRSAPGRTGSRSGDSRAPRASRPGARTGPTALRMARWSRCVAVWLRIVWARRSASTTARTAWPTATRPCSVPRWTIRPPTGRWVSSTVNSSSSVAASRIWPVSPTWPPRSA